VEAVSGASYSSKAFLNAMEAALTKQVGTAAPRSSSTEQAKGEHDKERVVAGDIFPVFVQTIPLPADLPSPVEWFYGSASPTSLGVAIVTPSKRPSSAFPS
jgi:hypothetical protein